MNVINRVALTYEEELLLEVSDEYQTYWISYEQYKENQDWYKVDYEVAKKIKHMKLAKKCRFLSSPQKCETKSVWECGLFFN